MGSTQQDFAGKRQQMVERQIKARNITAPHVLRAMATVPRESFVPEQYKSEAYSDGPLPIGDGQTISQPYIVALMTQSLGIGPRDRVLEIGTGSGYQLAVLLSITPHVYSVERMPSLAEKSRLCLESIGYGNVTIVTGDGTCGLPEYAPYDGIIVTSAAPSVPEPLKEQLSDGGRLVIPVGTRFSQILYRITRQGERFLQEEITPCVFVPLIGEHGWK